MSQIVLRDAPIRLVVKIVTLSLVFSFAYLIVALLSSYYPSFDNSKFWTFVSYDIATFVSLVIMQQIIIFYWLLKWIKRSYRFEENEFVVEEGIIFRKEITIPIQNIKLITQDQDWIGKILNYSTITISLINQPKAVVMPYMTNPEQVMERLGRDKF
ncbi:PH domain-containing protein [Candidatus Peribacteria bacterium]|jgi:uncharacterized membrane protein YdbT with pleckstrin-like domain|nr:PH domain-containing protein [Candidatus Peribacteria bacterium]MBT4021732.1 PH domain-containing protein [Candidatus Peribacteria bacterium]MBT4240605.1 PH domain-containing protein [Candidatus Peribacteria bacterium]MBT4474042.1 PH domain-containing protein [Candidatus Peribacteria bacterium]